MSNRELLRHMILIGPPGSGKGSQARLLSERQGFVHISTGDLLRREIASGSDLGKQIAERIDAGNFISDQLMLQLLKQDLDPHVSYVFDGYPRTMSQGPQLEEIIPANQMQIYYFAVPNEVVMERIQKRRICSECGASQAMEGTSPQETSSCCGGPLITRADDMPDILERRLQVYRETTEPLLQYYGDRVIKIDGTQAIEEVYTQIQKAGERQDIGVSNA